jgi:hypothetical protein
VSSENDSDSGRNKSFANMSFSLPPRRQAQQDTASFDKANNAEKLKASDLPSSICRMVESDDDDDDGL